MATQIPIIYKSDITAQASTSITAGTISTGTLTTIINTIAGNGGGCHAYQVFVSISSPPSGNATARIYYAGKQNAAPTNFDSGSLSVSIPQGTTGTIEAGIIYAPALYSQVKLGAEDYGFSASLIVVPILPEAQ